MKKKFVVHFHRASHDHWDLRLEMDGVLKSWAVPKAPPQEQGVRRLAVQVEDHDLGYINFEGIIPEGSYGAGTVEIWDEGEYVLESRSEKELKVKLFGKRLFGRYLLVHMKGKDWLMIKLKD